MKLRNRICVVVDGYSTGALLAGAFASYGYESVHVQTFAHLAKAQEAALKSTQYHERLFYDGNIDALISHLADTYLEVKCVVPGTEYGVLVADKLSEGLGLSSNGTAFSAARRDKCLMADTVMRAGLPIIPYIKCGDVASAVRWARQNCLFRVVIKPISSSGTFGFNICEGEGQIRETFHRLHRSADIFNDEINEVLVQPVVEGQEYSVNCVSYQGRPYVTDIWRTNKRRSGQSKVYDKETLVYEGDPVFATLFEYATKVLAALRIDYGPSHSEVMVGCDGQPVLIETAARLMGSLDTSLVTEALGHNPVQLSAEAYLAPHRFVQRLNSALPTRRRAACMVQMLSETEGTLKGFGIDTLRQLRTFHGADLFASRGDMIRKTINSYTSPGLVFLSGADEAEVDADYEAIRQMEKSGELYFCEEALLGTLHDDLQRKG